MLHYNLAQLVIDAFLKIIHEHAHVNEQQSALGSANSSKFDKKWHHELAHNKHPNLLIKGML